MKTIPLTLGYFAQVDDADYERAVAAGPWRAYIGTRTVYALNGARSIRLHRFILGITNPRIEVDHKDHNGLNCQRHNIRPCTHSQNLGNQRKTRGHSQYKGVQFVKRLGKWRARIGKQRKFLGCFGTEEEAARAYDTAAREYFGEFALCNFN